MDHSTREQASHLAVAAELRNAILGGGYPPGTRPPSEGRLASEFGCGRDTIRDAISVLRRELLLITERGFRALVPDVADRRPVLLLPGATVTARMPLYPELATLHCRAETPLLEVADTRRVLEQYPAEQVALFVP